ncbi:hypothetical protein [Saccharibacillus endophyticus]|uniref:DUF4309 domain-containing protein n=1 Tax=Saccharibacillus endophyticus TaxID=2060666 RepID=A0ABQ1ZIT4_9BACL|nr:hypothetical protein [Saccharibacillus endophyticus]GGH68028.1 hypothetical protein GCM10007362_01620 [Saccharibacillus endophyticus]
MNRTPRTSPYLRKSLKLAPAALIVALALSGCGNTSGNAPEEANAPADAAAEDGGANVVPGTGPATSGEDAAESPDAQQTEEDSAEGTDQAEDANVPDAEGVIDQVRAQLKLQDAVLPTEFELADGHYLTASIEKNEEAAFNVVFYETEEVVPVDDDSLAPTGETPILAIVNAESYADPLSREDIFFPASDLEDISSEMAVDLGNGIQGMQEGAAGTQYLTWKEGRWVLQIQSLSEDQMDQPGIARKMVDYLETHSLPAPDDAGRISAKYQQGGDAVQNIVAWNKGDVVYQIETQRVPLEALAMTVSVK